MKCLIRIRQSLFLLVIVLAGSIQIFAAQRIPVNLPLVFEPNQGQAPADVHYLLRGNALSGEFRADSVSLMLRGDKETFTQVRMRLVGTCKDATMDGAGKLQGHTNYFVGHDVARWLHGISNYSQIRYRHVYANTDLVFYGNGRRLEHDFEVRPGGHPSDIAFQFDGAKGVALSEDGDLQIQLAAGDITFKRPIAYQMEAGRRNVVDAAFVILPNGTVRFRLGRYDASETLVIDPVLNYATYLDNLSDTVSAIATDTTGNTYIAGLTFNATYPVTSGGFEQQCVSCATNEPAVFVTKLNPTGTAQIYSTFLGGSQYGQPFGLAVDSNGNAVVTGETESTDFPVKNPVSTVTASNGAQFAFVSSLSPDGSTLNYSSLMGGGSTISNAVALDTQGNAYITGNTDSPNYPVTDGALHDVSAQYPEFIVFVSKFSPTGTLSYSALVGDSTPQTGGGGLIGSEAIAVDNQGSAYITGGAGILWPTTAGTYATQLANAPFRAVFVTKMSPDGSKLNYSTFLGEGGGRTIALDSSQNAYVAGEYDTNSFPVTPNAYMSTSGSCCSFFSKVSSDGSQLLYSSLLGSKNGSGTTAIYELSVDANNYIWLAGATSDSQFPLMYPIQSIMPNNSFGAAATTSFISEFDPTGTQLKFSTYMGDVSGSGLHIALDATGKVHAAGVTMTPIYTTPGVFLGTVTPPPEGNAYSYPYAALVDPKTAGASLCLGGSASAGLSFGYLLPQTTQSQTIQVNNCGNAALTFSSITSNDAGFNVPPGVNDCTGSIAAGSSCTVSVEFAPSAAQTYTGQLTFTSNASVASSSIPLSGVGAEPIASFGSGGVNPTITFQPLLVGQTSPAVFAVLNNNGPVPLTISVPQIAVTGDFALAPGNDCAATVPAHSYCVILVTFKPTAGGTRTGTLSVPSNDPANPVVSTILSGTAYSSYPVPTITALLNPSYPINSGTTPISVTVDGSDYFPNSVVYVNGVAQPTTYKSSTFLTFKLDPTLLDKVGQIPVTVVNSTPGGGSSVAYPMIGYLSIPLATSALTVDPVGGLLYAAVPASAAQNPNTVIPIDPVTGAMMTPIAVSNDPQQLAVSDDGSELYVATSAGVLQRLNLKTLAIEKTFNLPVDSEWGQTFVHEMHVVPSSPHSIVVELFARVDPAEDGAALYNDSGLVNWLPGVGTTQHPLEMDSFTFTSPSAVYGLPENNGFFTQLQVSPSGLSFSGNLPEETSQQTGSIVRSDGTLLYTNSGQVWNPSTRKLLGTYLEANGSQLFYAAGVVPDTANGKTEFLDTAASYAQHQSLNIDVFDQTNFALLGTIPFMNLDLPDAIDLVRWGSNGIAFRIMDSSGSQPSANQIVIMTSKLIAQSSNGAPIPILSSVSPSSVHAGGPGYTMQLAGSGFTNASTVFVNGNPRNTTYVSDISLAAQVLASDIATNGQLNVDVTTPAPGGGTSNYAVVSVNAPAKSTPAVTVSPSSTSATTAQPLTVTVAVNGGSGKSVPTGTVTLTSGTYSSANATLASGSAAINVPAGSLPVGTDTLMVRYTPDSASASTYTTAAQSTTVSITSPIGTTAPTVTLTPSATNITNLEAVGVTVFVAGGSGQATPTGPVTLTSGTYSASLLLVNGMASFNIPAGTLSSGVNILTGTYAGDATYVSKLGTTTVTVSQVVISTITPPPVVPGASATTSVAITAGNSYSGTMNFTCTLLDFPAGAQSLPTCSLNPASVMIASGGNGTTNLTVRTTAASTTALLDPSQESILGFGSAGAAFAVVLLFVFPLRRRRWLPLAILLCAIVTAGVIGCGATGGTTTTAPAAPGISATTAGKYIFTVTGTDSTNAKVTVSSNIVITVQ